MGSTDGSVALLKAPGEAPFVGKALVPCVADQLLVTLSWLRRECVAPVDESKLLLQLEGGVEAFDKYYTKSAQIGQGAFGKVYACQSRGPPGEPHHGIGEELCVKVVPLSGRRAARVARVCEEEKRELLLTCLRIEHPNIATYYRFIQTDDALFTVMQRCCGPDLVDFVKEAPEEHLPIKTIRDLASQIFAAVAAVHSHGIMHRDVKPENFRFRDQDTRVLQLLDFGFAKPTRGSPAEHSVTGTLLYAAPEVFDGVYCQKCDTWSAGIVLFQLFVGDPPFQTSDVDILRALHRDPLLTGDSLFRGLARRLVPHAARDLVQGLVNVDPVERLSAEQACQHSWLFLENDSIEPAEDGVRKSTLVRCSSSISTMGLPT
mmetsp:Transcript_125491/g.360728  ORF Transcript_125491/g.360728 Transcript_125491/m.360728 type:complete len:375 (-) Transcript_125491:153-1277(-)